MEQQEKATITLDGNNYVIEDLSEKAQYCIGQIQDLQQQSNAARARLDQLVMSENGFMEKLREAIAEPEELPQD
jgi:FtsZ-binding cell division protein ZapB